MVLEHIFMLSVVIPVYRNAPSAIRLAEALSYQVLPTGHTLEVIAVDDGSGDDTAEVLSAANLPFLRPLILPRNSGRGMARNAGADSARGEFVVFIDCDCEPVGKRFLEAHLNALKNDCVACCGPLVSGGTPFWKRYQNEASRRREKQHADGMRFAGTTANFSVLTDVFRRAGGFDHRYVRYGFEDRDLLIRLRGLGQIGWCHDATVRHLDQLTLRNVLAKMRQAGGASAQLFSADHPAAYRDLGYAALDTRLHGWLRPVGALTRTLVTSAPNIERFLESQWLPYLVGQTSVKLLSALAFLQGTMDDTNA